MNFETIASGWNVKLQICFAIFKLVQFFKRKLISTHTHWRQAGDFFCQIKQSWKPILLLDHCTQKFRSVLLVNKVWKVEELDWQVGKFQMSEHFKYNQVVNPDVLSEGFFLVENLSTCAVVLVKLALFKHLGNRDSDVFWQNHAH